MPISKIISDLKGFYNQNSKYTTLLVGIPSLIGALWQGIELYTINPIFLRFFSISQLISDGILCITVVLSFILIAFFSIKIHKRLGTFYVFDKDSKYSLKLSILMGVLHIIYGGLIIYVFFFKNNLLEKLNITQSFFLVFAIIIGIPLILSGFLGSVILPILHINKKKSKVFLSNLFLNFTKQKGVLFNTYTGLVIIIFPFLLFLLIATPLKFREELINPKKIHNFSKIKCKIKADIGKEIKFKIRYFNDKFIFIEYSSIEENNEETNIIIYETNELLFNNNCK